MYLLPIPNRYSEAAFNPVNLSEVVIKSSSHLRLNVSFNYIENEKAAYPAGRGAVTNPYSEPLNGIHS